MNIWALFVSTTVQVTLLATGVQLVNLTANSNETLTDITKELFPQLG